MPTSIGPSRTVKVFKMFTTDGRAVYQTGQYGREYSTDGMEGTIHKRQPVRSIERLTEWDGRRTARAEMQLGVPCEWRETGTAEVMDVNF